MTDFFLCLWFNLRKALAVQSDVTGSGDKPHKDDANALLGLTLIGGGQIRFVRDCPKTVSVLPITGVGLVDVLLKITFHHSWQLSSPLDS